MEKNEIKKALYREKPTARFQKITSGVAYYFAHILDGDYLERDVNFEIPISEIGDNTFEETIPAQLLIRWMA